MIQTPEQILLLIRGKAEQVVGDCHDALMAETLATRDAEFSDSPEARQCLTHIMSAAKLLLRHLDENYDFAFGCAERKEETCPPEPS